MMYVVEMRQYCPQNTWDFANDLAQLACGIPLSSD